MPMHGEVTLRSYEGREFVIDEELAKFSSVLSVLLDRNSPFEESLTRIVELPIKSSVLERVVSYLKYRQKYSRLNGPAPDFEISEEESLDLLSVSFYLKI